MWWRSDALPWQLLATFVCVLVVGCSWTHHVRLQNTTGHEVEVAYKLSCPDHRCFFPDSAVVYPHRKNDPAQWTTHRLDRSDNTIRFTLPAGYVADLASTWNTTYSYIHANSGKNTPTDNLQWIRVTGPKGTREYTAAEFLQASETKRSGRTLLRITEKTLIAVP